MFIELVDALRCPVSHEESWLVAAASRSEFRHIVEGTLGCPTCHAQYPIRRGVADFRRGATSISTREVMPDEGEAARLAAFLDLTDRAGFAVLLGEWSAHATILRGLVETPLIIVDPADGTEGEPGISVIRCDGELPLAAGSARGIAIDGGSEARIASAVRATRPKGRIVAAASLPRPAGTTELARDERAWVAERAAASSPLVALHVRRAQQDR
jgi:uncharacterized protein YbaR (Trm112 family)